MKSNLITNSQTKLISRRRPAGHTGSRDSAGALVAGRPSCIDARPDCQPASGGPQHSSISESLADLRGSLKGAPENLAAWIVPQQEPLNWKSKPIIKGQGTFCDEPAILVAWLNPKDPNADWTRRMFGELPAPLITTNAVIAKLIWLIQRVDKSGAVPKILQQHVASGDIRFGEANQLPVLARRLREDHESLAPALEDFSPALTVLGIVSPMLVLFDLIPAPHEKTGRECPYCKGEFVRDAVYEDLHSIMNFNPLHSSGFGTISLQDTGRPFCPSCGWLKPRAHSAGTAAAYAESESDE